MTDHPVLARIRLNPRSRDVHRDLRDATQMHRTVMRLAPDHLGDSPRHESGLLYRVEEDDTGSALLVQGYSLDAARLPAGYGNTQTKSLAPLFQALRKGLPVRYRIVVNPAKRERLSLEHGKKRGPVVPLSGAEADEWWVRRAADAGLHLTVLSPTPLRPVLPRDEKAPRMRHSLLRYDGTGTVTDPDALTQALLKGIGRAKPYGAGLLSLAPARTA
jgi:CRISPR system Cascade subunit CasE